jgi:tRNA dimethylallyltransferase
MVEPARKIIVITGPTASGKSALSVELAQQFGGEIVNADSMQVYKGMDIGTAKPSPEVRAGIPHHLFDIVDPDEDFNAAVYRSLAVSAIEDVLARGRVCFLVGERGSTSRPCWGGFSLVPLQTCRSERISGVNEMHWGLKRFTADLPGLTLKARRKSILGIG